MYIYIYMYRERERKIQRERDIHIIISPVACGEADPWVGVDAVLHLREFNCLPKTTYIYVYIYIYIYIRCFP